MEPLVQLHQLQKKYQEGRKSRTIFTDLSCTFYAQEFAVLLGRSGSGKSTLLNMISGIEKPDSGDIFIGAQNVTTLKERERTLLRRDNIGIVFQFFNLIPTLTALENITLPQELAGKKQTAVANRAMELLDAVGLADRAHTFPDRLSGGEQQRIAIARALAHNPMLILADEPTGNLDEETGQRVLDLLLSLTRDLGKTLIMATHSAEIIPFANRVFRIQDGGLLTDE